MFSVNNKRLGLQTLFESIFAELKLGGTEESIEDTGSFDPATDANVYYQPPPDIQMRYPCIKYSCSSGDTKYANDHAYNRHILYMVTVIDEDPDSKLSDRISELSLCKFIRHYTADDKNHFVYDLYY